MEILDMGAVELAKAIQKRQIGALEATKAVLEQIEKKEQDYHCYITVDAAQALKQAELVEKGVMAGELNGPLAGVPIAIKDNICTRGIKTTAASKMLSDFVPSYDATVIEKLKAAGAVIIGKTNMDEFAMGSTTETSYFGATQNPYNTAHAPGGSSGGSAAAVAAKECFLALGSDTGGSVRQPASHCGVVGVKPTYGTVSRYGLIAYASSMDQIGPISKNVTDAAAVLDCIAGKDEKDATSVGGKQHLDDGYYMSSLVEDCKEIKIGIPTDFFQNGINQQVKKAIYEVAHLLKEAGAVVEECTIGMQDELIPAYYVIADAEASSNLERYDGIKYGYQSAHYKGLHDMYKKSRSEGFGEEVKRRIMLGSFVLSTGYYEEYYLQALRVRTMIKNAYEDAFKNYDVILSPVSPDTAPKLGESLKDPLQMYLSDIYTVAANLCGFPAISVSCGQDDLGLPIGVQMMGNVFSERTLLQIAYTYEQLSKR